MLSTLLSCVTAAMVSVTTATLDQDDSAGYEIVERTIMVPTWVTETRMVQETVYRNEQRERKVTYYEQVPKTETRTRDYTVYEKQQRTREQKYTVCKPVWKDVEYTYTVCVPETKVRQVTRTVCKPVWREVEKTYTVMVPHTEIRKGMRTVWKTVSEKRMRTVCKDNGHYETHVKQVPCTKPCGFLGLRRERCGGCGKCDPCGHCNACATGYDPCAVPMRTVCRKVWVPKIETHQVEYTCNVRKPFQVACQYKVTVCKPETRTRIVKLCSYKQEKKTIDCKYTVYRRETRKGTRKVCTMVPETRTRTVCYTVCVPKKKTRTYKVTTYDCVKKERTETYTVCVPHCIEKEVGVQVCKMIPKTITCKVPICD